MMYKLVNNFYLRFTSPKHNSLIIGTSRSAQGIHPNIIDSILNLEDINSIYNYYLLKLDEK